MTRLLRKRLVWITLLATSLTLTVVLLSCTRLRGGNSFGGTSPAPLPGTEKACLYWREVRAQPRPLVIHILAVDLRSPLVRVEALVAPDTDEDGPAEAALQKPQDLLTGLQGVVAAVNANAFGGLPDAQGKSSSNWHVGMPVDILGWACHEGRNRSAPQPGYDNFWVDSDNRAHVSAKAETEKAREAVAGFGMLMRDGTITVRQDTTLHPRTAAGTDKERQRVWLVVVDGRQKGYSEGMSCYELAQVMQALGCWEAVNLDGGGSSIMFTTNAEGRLVVANSPSGVTTRPIPTMIVVRTRQEAAPD